MSESLRGQFLIAGCNLRDPNFFKTVVLIVEHGIDGAMGLVVNRPSDCTVAAALSGHLELPGNQEQVYLGGPVEPAALFVIHNAACLDPQETPVVPDVYMGSSAEVFEEILQATQKCPEDLKYRVFSGCSGWGCGQLEDELSRGDWLTCDATACEVFSTDPYVLWDKMRSKAHVGNRLLPYECDDPECN